MIRLVRYCVAYILWALGVAANWIGWYGAYRKCMLLSADVQGEGDFGPWEAAIREPRDP